MAASLTKHEVVESITFHIAGAPWTSTRSGYDYKPEKCVVKKRKQGIMMVVDGVMRAGAGWGGRMKRTERYNIVGFGDYDPPPQWLRELWDEARKRANECS